MTAVARGNREILIGRFNGCTGVVVDNDDDIDAAVACVAVAVAVAVVVDDVVAAIPVTAVGDEEEVGDTIVTADIVAAFVLTVGVNVAVAVAVADGGDGCDGCDDGDNGGN